jgi:hypothetical protein
MVCPGCNTRLWNYDPCKCGFVEWWNGLVEEANQKIAEEGRQRIAASGAA